MGKIIKTNLVGMLLLHAFSFFCTAQHNNVNYKGEDWLMITYEQISYLEATDDVTNIEAAQKNFTNGSFKLSHKKYLNLGITSFNYWVAFNLINTTKIPADLILNLENPRLNEVDIYVVRKNQQQSFFVLGDNFPFKKRAVPFNQFAIPIELKAIDTLQVFMYMKHKGNTLQLPISLHTSNSFLRKTENNYLITGITSGILLLTLFFSIFLFFKSLNRLFIFYSLFVLSTLLWLLSTEGYGFQYLWPGHPEWATRFGPGFSVFILSTYIASALSFTKPYDSTKWIRRILSGISMLTFVWGLQAFMPYIQIYNATLTSFFLKTSFIVYGISLVIIIGYLLYVSITKNRIVLFYFFAIITSVILSLLLIASNSGWINLPFNSGNFISIGLVFGIVIMTMGTASQLYNYKDEKEAMLVEYLEQQKAITQKILMTEEAERKRIGRELHDDIGAGLTRITLMSDAAKNKAHVSSGDIEEIAKTCRQLVGNMGEIVWSLNPENNSLELLIAYMREELNKLLEYSGMNYTLDLPEFTSNIKLTNEQRRNLQLVTKELVNNAVKYSKAKNIIINASLLNHTLNFTIKDDGIGFKETKVRNGEGLRNIRLRIEELNGNIFFNSEEGNGTTVRYSINID